MPQSARKHLFSLFTLLLFVCSAQAFQQKRTLKISHLYQELLTTGQTSLTYEDVHLVDDVSDIDQNKDFIDKLSDVLGRAVPTDSTGIISQVKSLILSRVTGKTANLEMLHMDKLILQDSQFEVLSFDHIHIDSLDLYSNKVATLEIQDAQIHELYALNEEYTEFLIYNSHFTGFFEVMECKIGRNFWVYDSEFHEGALFAPIFEGTFTDLNIEGSTFHAIDSNIPLSIGETEENIYKIQVNINTYGKLNQMYLTENKFLNNGGDQFIFVAGEFDYMSVVGNQLDSHLYPDARVNKQLMFYENKITAKLIFSSLILQGNNNIMHWRDLGGFKMANALLVAPSIAATDAVGGLSREQNPKLYRQTMDLAFLLFSGTEDIEFEEEDNFQALISSYYRLYKTFKENGQIDDANHTYVEMKDVQLRKFRYLYKTHGGLENLIQWRLNSLLKFYTDYGTNPARAIRISIFVVLLFSIFYFFFPSEWDTKSKTQLIADYRTFIEKNQHGYFKPMLKLSGGFFQSLLNAMTLSLNAFVTLGFGTIPTSGLARYICILQGFMGWFLLSIFTASLINQVLF